MLNKNADIDTLNKIRSLEDFDVLDVAEKIAGNSSLASSDELALGLSSIKSRLLRNSYVDSGDFLFGDSLERRVALLERSGFERILRLPVKPGQKAGYETREVILHVFVNDEYGLVFTIHESWIKWQRDADYNCYITHGRCSFAWKPSPGNEYSPSITGGFESESSRKCWRKDPAYLDSPPKDLYLRGYLTSDSGLFNQLNLMIHHGTFFKKWPAFDEGENPLSLFFKENPEYGDDFSKVPYHERARRDSIEGVRRYKLCGERLSNIMNITFSETDAL